MWFSAVLSPKPFISLIFFIQGQYTLRSANLGFPTLLVVVVVEHGPLHRICFWLGHSYGRRVRHCSHRRCWQHQGWHVYVAHQPGHQDKSIKNPGENPEPQSLFIFEEISEQRVNIWWGFRKKFSVTVFKLLSFH